MNISRVRKWSRRRWINMSICKYSFRLPSLLIVSTLEMLFGDQIPLWLMWPQNLNLSWMDFLINMTGWSVWSYLCISLPVRGTVAVVASGLTSGPNWWYLWCGMLYRPICVLSLDHNPNHNRHFILNWPNDHLKQLNVHFTPIQVLRMWNFWP